MSFVPAHHVIVHPGATPTRTVWMLHGVFGTGRNWRSFARRLVTALPTWRALQVDLRNHGGSRGAEPPHTLTACAQDLVRLGQVLDEPPDVVCGHSFGGKVALAYARLRPARVAQVWLFDSPLGGAPKGVGRSEVGRLIDFLAACPMPVARRGDVTRALVSAGFQVTVAQWMATNLRTVKGGFSWHFDVAAVAAMLEDYWQEDFHGWLGAHSGRPDIHLVRAERSDRFSREDLERLSELPEHIRHHLLPNAGHWLHVDNPEGLLNVLIAHLSAEGHEAHTGAPNST